MKVPDVVQALSRITELSAVFELPIQFWLASNPRAPKSGFRPSAARISLKNPSGAARKIHRIVIAADEAIDGKQNPARKNVRPRIFLLTRTARKSPIAIVSGTQTTA